MSTALEVILYTLTAYLMYMSLQNCRLRNIALAGLAFGLASITRPIILPTIILFPLGLYFSKKTRFLKNKSLKSLQFFIFAFIPILPITMTNIIKGGEFVLISTQGGANFYIGNSTHSDGITVIALGPQYRIGKYEDNVWTSSIDEAERSLGRKLSQSQVSSYWYNRTLNEMMSKPSHALFLLAKKFYLFWHGQEIINIKSPYYAAEYSTVIRILLWKYGLNFPSGLLFPLMFLGFYFALHKWRNLAIPMLFILIIAISVSLFFICSRFRQPIVPLSVIFSVYSIQGIFLRLRKGFRKNIHLISALAILIIVLNWGGSIPKSIYRKPKEL